MKSYRNLLLLVILVPILAGCVVTFENPLPKPRRMKVQRALRGNWFPCEADKSGSLSIVPGKRGRFEIVSKGRDEMTALSGFSVRMGKYWLMCIASEKEDDGFIILPYRIFDGILHFYPMSKDKVKNLIEAGRLKGTVQIGRFSTSVTVSSSSRELRRVFRRVGIEKLLEENAEATAECFSRRPFVQLEVKPAEQ